MYYLVVTHSSKRMELSATLLVYLDCPARTLAGTIDPNQPKHNANE